MKKIELLHGFLRLSGLYFFSYCRIGRTMPKFKYCTFNYIHRLECCLTCIISTKIKLFLTVGFFFTFSSYFYYHEMM